MNYQEFQKAKETFPLKTEEKKYKGIYNLRDKFVQRFTTDKILNLSLDEYVIGKKNEDCFCYWVERRFDDLGRILGHTSYKFGVYYSFSKGIYEYEKRLGDDYKQAFSNVKKSIVDLIIAGKNEDYNAIVKNPINALFKGKILSLYYPDKYLSIFSFEHLNHYLKAFDLDTKELMKAPPIFKALELKHFKENDEDMKDWSLDMFAVFLWSQYPKPPLKEDEGATKTTKISKKGFPTPSSIEFIDQVLKPKETFTTSSRSKSVGSADYEGQERDAKHKGDRGESIVYQAERKRLSKELSITEEEAEKYIDWRARKGDDACGYDIKSIDINGTPRYIEVKATETKKGDMSFFYTENEYQTAKKYGDAYHIYIVYDIMSAKPRVWDMGNPFKEEDKLTLKPIKYKVEVKVEK